MKMAQTEIFQVGKDTKNPKEQFGLKEGGMEWQPGFNIRPGHLCTDLTSEELNRAQYWIQKTPGKPL